MENFAKKQESLNLGRKMLSLGNSRLEFLKTIFIFKISTLEFVTSQNFVKKKMLKFGTKKALFGYFSATVLKKRFSYLKSAPSNLSYYKTL